MHTSRDVNEGGFILAEALAALLVIAVMALTLSTLVGHYARSAEASRAASERAHQRLAAYQRNVRVLEGQAEHAGLTRRVAERPLTLLRPASAGPTNCLYDVDERACR